MYLDVWTTHFTQLGFRSIFCWHKIRTRCCNASGIVYQANLLGVKQTKEASAGSKGISWGYNFLKIYIYNNYVQTTDLGLWFCQMAADYSGLSHFWFGQGIKVSNCQIWRHGACWNCYQLLKIMQMSHTQHALFKENLWDRVLYTKDSSNII